MYTIYLWNKFSYTYIFEFWYSFFILFVLIKKGKSTLQEKNYIILYYITLKEWSVRMKRV